MRILISGASGLVGKYLIPELEAKGHQVCRLVRKSPASESEIQWDADTGILEGELSKAERIDAVIHLAGDNVAEGYWTEEKKARIRDSRIVGTRVLVDSLKNLKSPPKIFISASAIGFYGNRGDEVLTEDSPAGTGFFPEVCSGWEAEAKKAEEFARVVSLRIGVVVAKDGGALGKMLTPFKLGAGGAIGSGKQYMPWIAIDDVIGIILFALDNDVSGPLNTTAPNPVTNSEFTKTLGKVLNRPTFMAVPEFAIKLMFGEMGERLLLEGCRVIPKRLQDLGYTFKFSDLESAFEHVLN
jgi:hypothetical protein